MSKQFIISNTATVEVAPGVEMIDPTGTFFPDEDMYDLRFATFDILTGKIEVIPDLPDGASPDYTRTANRRGSEKFFHDLMADVEAHPEKPDTLFFVHGFDTDLAKVKENMAWFYQDYVASPHSSVGRVVAFHWPSNVSGLSKKKYRTERQDAMIAGVALARAYMMLHDFLEVYSSGLAGGEVPIHLLCHSMGNHVFYCAAGEMMHNHYQFQPVFREVVLAAPDVDYDSFSGNGHFRSIHRFGKCTHIYMHANDQALAQAEMKNATGVKRLGRHGPKDWMLPANVAVVDCTDQPTRSKRDSRDPFLHHWYYYASEPVVNDIRNVLNG